MKNLLNSKVDFKLLRFNQKKYNGYFILFTILLFSSFPLPLVLNHLNRHSFLSDDLSISIVILLFFGVLLAIITPFIIYTYLTSKKAVDVYHALPIKRTDLFLTNNLSSYLLVIIPFAIAYFSGYLFGDLFGYYVTTTMYLRFFAYAALLIAIQSFTIFVIMNTGTLSDSFIHTGIVFLIPFVIYAATNTFSDYIFAVSSISTNTLKVLSPVYTIFSFLDLNQSVSLLSIFWILVYLFVTCFSLRLYNSRKSEKSEVPFVNNYYFPIVTGVFVCLVFVIFNSAFTSSTYYMRNVRPLSDFFDLQSMVISIAFTYVGYMILNFFRYRSTKYFLKNTLQYLIMIAITCAISTVLIITQLFGYAWHVPKASSVESITFKDLYGWQVHPLLYVNTDVFINNEYTITDAESIEEFVAYHKFLMKSYKENGSDFSEEAYLENESTRGCGDGWGQASFEYTLKSNRNISRSLVSPYQYTEALSVLLDNEGYQKIINPILDESTQIKGPIYYYNNTMTRYQRSDDKEFLDTIRTLYLQDLKNVTSDTLAYQASNLKYIVRYEAYVSRTETATAYLYVDDRFPLTVNYLENRNDAKMQNEPTLRVVSTDSNNATYASCGVITTNGYHYIREYYYSEYNTEDEYVGSVELLSDYLEGHHFRKTQSAILVIDDIHYIPLNPEFKP